MCKITSLVIVGFLILLMRNKGYSLIKHHRFSLQIIPAKGSPNSCIADHIPFLKQDEEKWTKIHAMIGMFVIKKNQKAWQFNISPLGLLPQPKRGCVRLPFGEITWKIPEVLQWLPSKSSGDKPPSDKTQVILNKFTGYIVCILCSHPDFCFFISSQSHLVCMAPLNERAVV